MYLILVSAVKNIVNIHAESYSNFLLFLVSGILGTVMIALVSRQIEILIKDNVVTKSLIFIGQNTFIYYAFQSKAIRLIDLAYNKVGFQIDDYLRSPLYAVVVCLVLAIPAVVVNRWFPFLMGRKRS